MSSFGPYTLIRRLAVGGMAEIFLAKRDAPGGAAKVVALKHILPHLAGARDFVEMFLDESRIAAGLSHPNIVRISDLGEHDGSYFLAMEYVPGDDLATLLQRAKDKGRRFPLKLCTMILTAACDALHHAHEQLDEHGRPLSIVHRDVSPSNLLLSIDGAVKLTDFGVAKAERKISQTVAGTRKGKGAYMSPEQARGRQVDRRSDVFALGAVAWELVTGDRLFQREGEVPTLHAVTEDPIPPPRTGRPDLPDDLEAVILRALDRNPAERWPTARAMQRALEEAARAYGAVATAKDLAAEVRLLLGPMDVRLRERWAAGDTAESVDQTAKLTTLRVMEPITDALSVAPTREVSGMFEHPTRQLIHPALAPTPRMLDVEREDAIEALRDDEPTQQAVLSTITLHTAELQAAAHLGAALRAGPPPVPPPSLRTLAGAAAQIASTDKIATTGAGGVSPTPAPMELNDVPPGPPARVTRQRVIALALGLGVGAAGFVAMRPFGGERSVVPLDAARVAVASPDGARAPVFEVMPDAPATKPDAARAPVPVPVPATRPDAAPATHVLDFGGPKPDPAPAETKGFLTVDIGDHLRVLLDDQDIGSTPITKRPVAPGKHSLALVSRDEGFRIESTFSVRRGELHVEKRALKQGRLACDATPWAEVYVGARKLGITPLPPVALTQGTYQLRFVNPKSKQEKTVPAKITPGKTTRLRVTLE